MRVEADGRFCSSLVEHSEQNLHGVLITDSLPVQGEEERAFFDADATSYSMVFFELTTKRSLALIVDKCPVASVSV
jgi:hypothetical protein